MFDRGFSHTYPLRNGIVEDLVESKRTLIERIPEGSLFQPPETIAYPVIVQGNFAYHQLPRDARDLTSYMRLLRTERNAQNVGELLGHRLAGVNSFFGGVPDDTVIPRFSVHASEEPTVGFQGIDMKLLPPFTRLSNHLTDMEDMVAEELERIDGMMRPFAGIIIKAMKTGIDYVG